MPKSTDIFPAEKRSAIMSSVKSKNTRPEILVRSMLHRLGYRFRLYGNDLPGKPDIILSKYKTIIFVHGCFWHQHPNCKKATYPKNNADFWKEKLDSNAKRDLKNQEDLERLGWNVIVVWECETKNPLTLAERLKLI